MTPTLRISLMFPGFQQKESPVTVEMNGVVVSIVYKGRVDYVETSRTTDCQKNGFPHTPTPTRLSFDTLPSLAPPELAEYHSV